MKNNRLLSIILIILCISTYAQNTSPRYTQLWKKVYGFEKEELPKSANTEVEKIYIKARIENNTGNLIKALLYQSKFMLTLEENAQLKIITRFKKEIIKSSSPQKNILENILATLYWQYFQQHRYQFYQRNKTAKKVEIDFRTWDLETLFSEIHLHFQNSLQNGIVLQQTPLTAIDILLKQTLNSKKYRPSLFDFLAHNALDFYKTPENSISKPRAHFTLNNKHFLGYYKKFNMLNLASNNQEALQYNALKIYQELSKFHSHSQHPEALAQIELERTKFVLQYAVFPEKNRHYFNTIQTYYEQLQNTEAHSLFAFELASIYNKGSASYQKNILTPSVKALEICRNALVKDSTSIGAKRCQQLKNSILKKSLRITLEAYVPINKPSFMAVNYRNITTLQLTAYSIDKKTLKKLQLIKIPSKRKIFIRQLSVYKKWTNSLKDFEDYKAHTTEIVVPGFSNGQYLIIAESADHSSLDTYSYALLQATDLVLVKTHFSKTHQFQVVNRNNGTPIFGAMVHISNNNSGRYNHPINTTLKTDTHGFINLKTNSYHQNITYQVHKNEDKAYFGTDYLYETKTSKTKIEPQEIFVSPQLFTDRSIYRPGQTLFFKGILLKRIGEKSSIVANEYVKVSFTNVNGVEISTIELKTNEYGSFSGEFIIPNNGLNGEYTIEVDETYEHDSPFYDQDLVDFDYNETTILVEEYKRPTFEASFNPITETFKLQDSVQVSGTANAYAGATISDAKVSYRVFRRTQYPSWWFWGRSRGYQDSSSQEICQGSTRTDAKGNFKITFKAIPDAGTKPEGFPVFNFEITADITDINGETSSTSQTVRVGYHSMTLHIDFPSNFDQQTSQEKIKISAQNLNYESIPSEGVLEIFKLTSAEKPTRKRPWKSPEYHQLSKKEFELLFPHDNYKDISDKNTKETSVYKHSYSTSNTKGILPINIKNWDTGNYRIQVNSTDPQGVKVSSKANFELSNSKQPTVNNQQLMIATLDKKSYKIGETALLKIGSASKDITITIGIDVQGTINQVQQIHLNNTLKTIKIPITKAHLKGLKIHYYAVNYNSFLTGALPVSIDKNSTNLQIITQTFRDHISPGGEETWSFTIQGNNKRQDAEVLASMYDASLDQFKKHQWNFQRPNTGMYYSYRNSNARLSFNTRRLSVNFNSLSPYIRTNIRFDQMNWFGFSFNNNNYIKRQYIRKLISQRSNAETIISGIVSDETGPLPGVSVIIKGTSFGTETDFDGYYELKANNNDQITFSYLGFESLTINTSEITERIILKESPNSLDEIVVTALGISSSEEVMSVSLRGAVAGLKLKTEMTSGNSKKMIIRGISSTNNDGKTPIYIIDGILQTSLNIPQENILSMTVLKRNEGTALYGSKAINGVIVIITKKGQQALDTEMSNVRIRTNFKETAFFYPHLKTDKKGTISFSFTSPEALTRWKVQLLAHTKNATSGYASFTTITQKKLMITPNAPRFLRAGDRVIISSKISNLTDTALLGNVQLQLFDALTNIPIDSDLQNNQKRQTFTVDTKGNTSVSWELIIPDNVQAVLYKIIAKAGDFSDGEQHILPVLSNRMLVTETMPMWVKSNETKTFTLDKLKNNNSSTLKHHKLTLEITSNPAWYALQSLPYLMEYPYECAEQTFARYYANSLANYVVQSNPRIALVFEQWKSSDALLSNLEKNKSLKSILISETPWLRDAQSESEQKKRIALLFDLNKLKNEQGIAIEKLKKLQFNNGGFPWFKGSKYPNRTITQHIASGFGHLKKLGVNPNDNVKKMLQKALRFLDDEIVNDYKNLIQNAQKYSEQHKETVDQYLAKQHVNSSQIHYLYMRSFYNDVSENKKTKKAIEYYHKQTATFWKSFGLQPQGMIALIHHREGNEKTALQIVSSLEENSIRSEALGMYWKSNIPSWNWYQSPIETQALLIEVFNEIKKDTAIVDDLKIWLLKNKQVSQWNTTKGTTEAVYALLLQGSDWLSVTESVETHIGTQLITPNSLENTNIEAGTGYYKTTWDSGEITSAMSSVTLTKKGKGIAWGALYWQYFEELDKLTSAKTPLQLSKKLFLKTNDATGKLLTEITDKSTIKVGDLITARIVLKVDRTMEFIHLKDMRASGLEPINVLSSYKWQDGLGYYESTKDAATNFFIEKLPKGVYVFEYDLRVNNAGDFSNGITTIQSMYAPEFSSHSNGLRLKVE